ncbi:MAG: DUF2029 domain-containing protein [Rhodobacteraceae bacterium]|nr:DUF2029 domain-containing protein [Paracoccaceae bacterium]
MTGSTDRHGTLGRVFVALVVVLLGWLVVKFAVTLPTLGAGQTLVDFDAFYITGQLVAEGRAADAYDPAVMAAIQRDLIGHEGFMPWTYPPPFDLLVAAFPLLPRGIAYALFTGASLAAYLWLLARLAGPALAAVLLALLPPVYVSLVIGQNSFLTGGLMAGFAALTLRSRSAAGWPLGLLVIKPHLGIGLGVHALVARRWRVLGIALAVALGLSLLSTLLLGPGIWAAFRGGVDAARQALATDFYPFFRMTSVYALLHSLGAPPAAALGAQVVTAVAACVAVAWAVLRRLPPRQALATACFASALVSPYLYDYDMTIVGVGAALVAGDLLSRTSVTERLLMLALMWVAGGWGMIHALATAGLEWEDRAATARATIAFSAAAYLLLLALAVRILSRPRPA